MGGVFVCWLCGGLAFGHGSEVAWRVIVLRRPCAKPLDLAVALLVLQGFFASADEGILCAGDYRDVGAADELESAESVGYLFGEPSIAGHDRDAEDFCFRRLDEEQDGLLVAACRAEGVLVNDDLAFVLGCGGEG